MTKMSDAQLSHTLAAVSRAFRLGMEGQGSEHLITLMDLTAQHMETTAEDTSIKFSPILTKTLDAIARKDYLYAADLLDYELAPLLNTQ